MRFNCSCTILLRYYYYYYVCLTACICVSAECIVKYFALFEAETAAFLDTTEISNFIFFKATVEARWDANVMWLNGHFIRFPLRLFFSRNKFVPLLVCVETIATWFWLQHFAECRRQRSCEHCRVFHSLCFSALEFAYLILKKNRQQQQQQKTVHETQTPCRLLSVCAFENNEIRKFI